MELAIVVFVLVIALIAAWIRMAGDREGQMYDDEPQTLDVQNHKGD